MRFGSYILLMFSIAFAFYLFGQQSAIAYVLGTENKQTTITSNLTAGESPLDSTGNPVYNNQIIEPTTILQNVGTILSSTLNIQNLVTMGAFLAIAVTAAALTGFSSMYFIPLILLILFVPYLMMPIGMFIDDPACLIWSPTGAIGSHDKIALETGAARDYPSDTGNPGSMSPTGKYASAAAQYSACISKTALPYKDVIRLFINILTVLAFISFIRGGV